MPNTRELSQLASLINVNDETKSIRVLTNQPDAKLGVGTENPIAKVDVSGDVNVSGFVTATSFYGDGSNLSNIVSGVGIQSNSVLIGTGITTLNFVGIGNTFFLNGNTVDISISGGGGASVTISEEPPENPSEGDLWYSSIYGRTFIYYEDIDSSQWVDASPFNMGIIDSLESLSVSGIITASAFYGDGSNLTGVSAGSTVADDTSTDETFYPLFTQQTSGTVTASKISTTKLSFNPSSGTLNAVELNATSDENLKENIRPIENPLNKILQITGVEFDWKETQQPSVGVIAQEIEKVFPELVKTGENKSVNYNGLIGVLIEAMKEQQKQIEELKKLLNK
jgi:hypothetical protein